IAGIVPDLLRFIAIFGRHCTGSRAQILGCLPRVRPAAVDLVLRGGSTHARLSWFDFFSHIFLQLNYCRKYLRGLPFQQTNLPTMKTDFGRELRLFLIVDLTIVDLSGADRR
ncbi:MAG: hypothetical protein ABJB69_10505, partial [Spartobacteria bacterium]